LKGIEMHKKIISLLAAPALAMSLATPAQAALTPALEKKFANCTALNLVYSGGVAKTKTTVNKGGKTKVTPTVNLKVYNENKSKDRDGDGIACER
jgi:hypothetical protein